MHVSSSQAVGIREAEGPSPEDCFVCARRRLWLQAAVHVGPGQTHASSRLSDEATAVGWIPYTPPQCSRGTARRRRQRPAAHALGIRDRTVQGDRTVHMGRCRQDVSIASILFFVFPFFSRSMLLPRGCSSWDWTRWALDSSLKAHTWHAARSKMDGGSRAM